jgi:Zn-dependent peptidase ImmA (M78 family)
MSSVLSELRKMRPPRELTRAETLRVAEHQAAKLRKVQDATDAPVPEEVISELPRIEIERSELGRLSGVAHWEDGLWHIAVNRRHARVRQRFSIAHEFHHVLEAPFERWAAGRALAEEAADYFAACLLMPRPWIKRLWARDGVQDEARLARHCDVSRIAMERRLVELGLMPRSRRCAPIRSRPDRARPAAESRARA